MLQNYTFPINLASKNYTFPIKMMLENYTFPILRLYCLCRLQQETGFHEVCFYEIKV